MKSMLLLSFTLLVNTAWAGGYQGALERLWIFYAYQIDGLNPDVNAQTLGWRCVGLPGQPAGVPPWDRANRRCTEQWQSCSTATTGGTRRCTFNQLMYFLGRLRGNERFVPGTNQAIRNPPIQETAINYYNHFVIDQQSNVPNYKPEAFLLSTNGEYTDLIDKVGDLVVNMPPEIRAANLDLIDNFKDATRQIIEARVGDNGQFLFSRAQQFLGDRGMNVVAKPVGTGQSPVNNRDGNPVQWQTIDWEATIAQSDLPELEKLNAVSDFTAEFETGMTFDNHMNVIKAYKLVNDKLVTC